MGHLWQGWLCTENANSSKGKCILLLKKVTITVEPVLIIKKNLNIYLWLPFLINKFCFANVEHNTLHLQVQQSLVQQFYSHKIM